MTDTRVADLKSALRNLERAERALIASGAFSTQGALLHTLEASRIVAALIEDASR